MFNNFKGLEFGEKAMLMFKVEEPQKKEEKLTSSIIEMESEMERLLQKSQQMVDKFMGDNLNKSVELVECDKESDIGSVEIICDDRDKAVDNPYKDDKLDNSDASALIQSLYEQPKP